MPSSRIKSLPSDVVLAIIAYLDSQTMMNCREVCRHWLDVVEAHRFLWDYFWVRQDKRKVLVNMLRLFSSKSKQKIKVFDLYSSARERPYSRSTTGKAVTEILLESKDSLKIWSHVSSTWDDDNSKVFLLSHSQFKSLETFRGSYSASPSISVEIKNKSQIQMVPFNKVFSSFVGPWLSDPKDYQSFLKSHMSTLVHAKFDVEPLRGAVKFKFPQLRILEIPAPLYEFPSSWSSPKLKILCLGVKENYRLVKNLPLGVEQIWLLPKFGWGVASLASDCLDPLKNFYPRVEVLRIDCPIAFHLKAITDVVKTRKEAAEEGLKVQGMEMRAIKKLVIDFRDLRTEFLCQLRELVPEVVSSWDAVREIVIHC